MAGTKLEKVIEEKLREKLQVRFCIERVPYLPYVGYVVVIHSFFARENKSEFVSGGL
jgi:hypothetical protein